MAVTYIGKMNVPNYLALSSDVGLGGTIPGVVIKGAIVYYTDTSIWKIVKDDLTLEDYALPISFNGSVDIGAVHIDQNITESIEIAPVYATKSIGTPGTAEPLVGSNTYCMSATIVPKVGNVGNVYFGDSGVDKTTQKEITITTTSAGVVIDAPLGYKLNLKKFYIDVDNGTDGVNFIYLS